jgi:hypothetical protein
MNAIGRLHIATVMALTALFSSSGTARAGMDNEMVLLDEQGRTLTIQQWDTFSTGSFPLTATG